MRRGTKLKIHPVADRFPLMEGEEFDALVTDIKANGLHEPITLSADGKVLIDGRNRLRACEKASVKPRFKKLSKSLTGLDIIKLIISRNITRRHLNVGQRAMLALDIAPDLEKAAKERQREHGKTAPGRKSVPPKPGDVKGPRDREVGRQLAEMFNLGHGTISQAKKVRASKKEADEVLNDRKSLNEAYKQVRRAERQSEVPKEAKLGRKMGWIEKMDGERVPYPLPRGLITFNRTNQQVDWAGNTSNVITGCLHNCPYCYAREGATMNENLKKFYPLGFEPTFHEYRLAAFDNTKVPKEAEQDLRLARVFHGSMSDYFGRWVPNRWIEPILAKCREHPEWQHLFLTKFPQRYVELQEKGIELPPTAWLGTTVDDQYRVKIAEEAFRKVRSVLVKWLSLEPLLALLEFSDLSMFDWVVIGAQTATNQPDGYVPEFAPQFEWVMHIVERARKGGCGIYMKPNLLGDCHSQSPGMKLIQQPPRGMDIRAISPSAASAIPANSELHHG